MSARAIGSLFVEFKATAEQWAADMKRMQKDAEEFGKVLKPIKQTALEMGEGLSVIGDLVVGTLVEMTHKAAEYGAEIFKAASITGISTEALSGLKIAADETGVGFEALTNGLNKLAKNSLAAADGHKQQATAFKSLGVAVTDTQGHLLPMNDLLLSVADRFAAMPDGTEKAALAMQLFGKAGAQLIPLLNQGAEGLRQFQERADLLGTSLSKEQAEAAHEFELSLQDLKEAFLGLSVTIGNALMPYLTELAEYAIGIVVAIKDWAKAHEELIVNVAKLAALIGGAGGLFLAIAGILAIWPALVAAFTFITGPIGLTVLAIGAVIAAFAMFPQVREVVIDTLKAITQEIGAVIGVFGTVAQAIWKLVTGDIKGAWDAAKTAPQSAAEGWKSAGAKFDSVTGAISSGLDKLKIKLPEIKTGAEDASDGITHAGKAIDEFQKQIEELVKSVTKHNDESRALQAALGILEKQQVSSTVITDALGKKLLEVAAAAQLHGDQLPSLVAKYAQLAAAQKLVTDATDDFKKKLLASGDGVAALELKLALLNGRVDHTELLSVYSAEIVKLGKAHLEAGGTLDPFYRGLYDEAQAFEDNRTAIVEYNKMLDSAEDSLQKLKRTPQEVAQAFATMRTEGKSDAEITAVLGSKIKEAIDISNRFPGTANATTAALLSQAKATVDTTQATDELAKKFAGLDDSLKKLRSEPGDVIAEFQHLQQVHASSAEITHVLGSNVDQLAKQLLETPEAFSAEETAAIRSMQAIKESTDVHNKFMDSVKAASDSIQAMERSPYEAAEKFRLLSQAVDVNGNRLYSDAEIVGIMGSEIDKAAENARRFNIPLDENTRLMLQHAKAAKDNADFAEKWYQAWHGSIDKVKSGFADGVAQMIVHGQNLGDSLKKIFQDIASTIIKVLVEGALTKLAGKLSGLLFGNGGGGEGGGLSLSSLFGGGNKGGGGGGGFNIGSIAGIFGGGKGGGNPFSNPANYDDYGNYIPDMAPGGGGAIQLGMGGASAATGIAGLFSKGGLTSSLSGYAAIAQAGMQAIQMISQAIGKIGQGRKAADAFVPAQNAFVAALGSLVNPLTAKKAAGTETKTDVATVQKILEQSVSEFMARANSFGAIDATHQKVVDQGMKDILPVITTLRANLAADYQAASGVDKTLTGAAGAFDASVFDEAEKRFALAVDKMSDAINAQLGAKGGANPSAINVGDISINLNPTFEIATKDLSKAEIRDSVIPELVDVLDTGIRGVREKVASIIKNTLDGVVTQQVPA